MPYDSNDPRSQLSTAVRAPSGVPRAAHYREQGSSPADETHEGGGQTWWTRSQAMVIGYSHVEPGDVLTTADIDGEHGIIVIEGATLEIEHGNERAAATDAVVFVPAGTSTLRATTAGTVIRVLAADTCPALADGCHNSEQYATPDGNVAEFAAWPDPSDGPRIRVYPLADHPITDGLFGRIFRCSTVMINVLPEANEPRDPSKLSPHLHDDFEQVSLQVSGDYVHHMRVTWTPDSTTWRNDEHQACTAPAVVVIPPPLVHTSQAVNPMHHWLIDVFAPPRFDFSAKPGWIRNADEYPMPEVAS